MRILRVIRCFERVDNQEIIPMCPLCTPSRDNFERVMKGGCNDERRNSFLVPFDGTTPTDCPLEDA